jgi:hypothetical protein
MKISRFFAAAGTILAIGVLALTGCKQDPPEPKPDSRLINTWENGDAATLSGLYKDFVINGDYTFTAHINPPFIQEFVKARAQNSNGLQADWIGGAKQAIITTYGAQGATAQNVDAFIKGLTWTVTGKLSIDGGEIYIMSDLAGTSTAPGVAEAAVKDMDGSLANIHFTDNDTFEFSHVKDGDENTIGLFFGGTYTVKVTP